MHEFLRNSGMSNVSEIQEFLRNSTISAIFPDTPADELAAVVVAAGVAIVAVGVQQDTNIQLRVRISPQLT